MLQTIRQACRFDDRIFDYRMAEGVENLSDLIHDAGDGRAFFARNHVTQGMNELFREALLRLSGKSDQAVFELSQAMGGGKTHLMIALGLMARHAPIRREYLATEIADQLDIGDVQLAAFNGRNRPKWYVWGEIGAQLGKKESMRPYWADGPEPVDEAGWMAIIGERPTLIMLDELPPYLDVAATIQVGGGTLANITTYSLACLMSAALKLPRCCVVIANLAGSYQKQTGAISEAITNLRQEARRQARTITPVSLAGNEIYQILRKRLVQRMPEPDVITEVAAEYAQRIKAARDGGHIDAVHIDNVIEEVEQTYPFHPSFKHIVALFKENESFRQTRGLMQFAARLLKSAVEREADDVYLAGTQHLNLNEPSVRNEIARIADRLQPALARDIADEGSAIAEEIDAALGSDAARQAATLLLSASLSRAGGRLGLAESEAIEFLAAPDRKPDEFKKALDNLREKAWYIHREDERLFFKETENLSRQIERNAQDVPPNKVAKALENRLTAILTPHSKQAWQVLHVMPEISEISLNGPRVLLVVRPDGKTPPSTLREYFEFAENKNNLLILSGEHSYLADAVETRQREVYAIDQICKRLTAGDTLYEEARERQQDAALHLDQAISAAYNRLYFPGTDDLGHPELVKATIDNGLKIGAAEAQIEELLASPRCNQKLAADMRDNLAMYWAMAEAYLWPQGGRRVPWRDVAARAKSNPLFSWLPGANGIDTLKNEALKQGHWREGQDGYIEKGPFPPDKTGLSVTVSKTNAETGEIELALMPRHAGPDPVIHYADHARVGTDDPIVDDPDAFVTTAATLYFLVVDRDGRHESGEPVCWKAPIKIRHQVENVADERRVRLESSAPGATIRYTLDGSNPKEGRIYDAPFCVRDPAQLLSVYAEAGQACTKENFQIPANGDERVQIVDDKPARLNNDRRVSLDTTDKVFGVINAFKQNPETRFRGVTITIGENERAVSVRFQEREVCARDIEATIVALRGVLGSDQEPVSVRVWGGVNFTTGFDAREFARLSEIDLKPADIVQEEAAA